MNMIFLVTSLEKHHNLLFEGLKRFNKNDTFKQLDDITTPAMILKFYIWNNNRRDTFLNWP